MHANLPKTTSNPEQEKGHLGPRLRRLPLRGLNLRVRDLTRDAQWRYNRAFFRPKARWVHCLSAVLAQPQAFELFNLFRFRFFKEPIMAVQQNKKSPSKRGMHRSHNALGVPGLAIEPTSGEVHLRHHISPNGIYRGRQVLKNKEQA